MSTTTIKQTEVEEAKEQIFDIILALPAEDQNEIVKNLRSSLIQYRHRKMKEAETELKRHQTLFHDICG